MRESESELKAGRGDTFFNNIWVNIGGRLWVRIASLHIYPITKGIFPQKIIFFEKKVNNEQKCL